MTILKQIKANLRTLDINSIIRSIISREEVKDFIIDLNTNKQLFGQGENSFGVRLENVRGRDYSDLTVQLKIEDGLPFDRITLFQTGEFYSSFVVIPGNDYFTISADPIKGDDNLFDDWGEDILGLQDENLQQLIFFIKDAIIQEFKRAITRGL